MDTLAHDSEIQGKINHACKVIEECLGKYDKPCLLSSFGKDSILMLWMVREWYAKDIPIVYLKPQWFPRKHAFAEKVIAEWELDVHANIPPLGYSITSRNGKTEIVRHFSMGAQQMLLPIGKIGIEGQPKWLCGQDTLLKGPVGTFTWPWDVAFHGHKDSDIDPMKASTKLNVDIHQIANTCDLAYPLRHFTDADVWKLTEKYKLPFNRLRYESFQSPSMDQENFFNEDYYPYCNKCFDPREPDFVVCPKTGLEITNIHDSLVKSELQFKYNS